MARWLQTGGQLEEGKLCCLWNINAGEGGA